MPISGRPPGAIGVRRGGNPAISSQYRRDRWLSRFAPGAPLPDSAARKRRSRMRRKDWTVGGAWLWRCGWIILNCCWY